ncbi:hypothetical protein JKF63_07415 [Porcisia hertigi]|uniref:Uncharacterized protein n=1 Tax=Porcisia hertigi TaxID=2761500 RepID=A0A836LKW2_9TRYP|nr:hypothetical protein JKF63_07415 [Porcisia hertigi]
MQRVSLAAVAASISSATSSSGEAAATLVTPSRSFRKELFEGPLDLKPGERNARKGPPVAHSLPVYKTTHKLHSSVRWKNANLVANVAGGQDYRLRETQGEGTFDETGMYRDWLYGDERRYANYVGLILGGLAIALFWYTVRMIGTETWDIPTPVLASQRKRLAKEAAESDAHASGNAVADVAVPLTEKELRQDALAMLKRPTTVSKSS